MNTDLLMHESGLDHAGKSQLSLDELLLHLMNAKAIELLDAAVNGFGSGMTRLSIRNDGTFLTLPNRVSAASSGLEMASVWLMALESHAFNPCDSTRHDLQEAEEKLGRFTTACLKTAVANFSRSEAVTIPISVDGKIIKIGIPHKATVAAALNDSAHSTNDHEGENYVTIKEIRHGVEATSTSGIVVLLSPDNKNSEIRSGTKILVKINKKQVLVGRLQHAKIGEPT